MLKYTINLGIESLSIFLYYIVQGFGLLTLNFASFLSLWSPTLNKKIKKLSTRISRWFNDHIGY